MISLGLSTGAWFDMLTVVYVYVLSDTLHFILLKMVLRDTAVNINSTLTEEPGEELQRKIQINTAEQQCGDLLRRGLSVC